MPSIKDITTMCKAGQIQEAYELAKVDLEQGLPWAQREMGWVLYYQIKVDADTANYQSLLSHLEELKSLDQLTFSEDKMIYENVLFKVAMYVKTNVPPSGIDSSVKLSALFSKLKSYSFSSSKGYSFLLQSFIRCDGWLEMADFLDWWNLDNLTQDDYEPYKIDKGKAIMSVAERAYIAKSKSLLRLNDSERIKEFLPKLDNLMNLHPEMTWPGFFYGKLLLSLDSTTEEELRVILPFARKKAKDFWVWQLLSDVFVNDHEKQLACLLRAVHCNTQEKFLVNVRLKLARLFILEKQFGLAKFQIDKVTQCCLAQGFNLPFDVKCWIHEPWINTAASSDQVPIDYLSITDTILCEGTEEAVAVVTWIDTNSNKATLIYGKEKRMIPKLPFKVGQGVVLKINYIIDSSGKPHIIRAGQTPFPRDLDFAKVVEGTTRKRTDKDFAFLKTTNGDFFIAPNIVRKYDIQDGEFVKCLVVYDYNWKKETWDWTCVSTNKNKNIIKS